MKRFICAAFDQEQPVIDAVAAARTARIPLYDVYTPYAVHGLDEAMGITRSRLPWVCLIAGGLGGLFALGFQMWTFAINWPLVVGGKPFLAIPAFIPVTFELTVLLGGLSTVAAFLLRSKLFPGRPAPMANPRVTDQTFVMAVEIRDGSLDPKAVKAFFAGQGAVTVYEKEADL